jgi:hypothetical protein
MKRVWNCLAVTRPVESALIKDDRFLLFLDEGEDEKGSGVFIVLPGQQYGFL